LKFLGISFPKNEDFSEKTHGAQESKDPIFFKLHIINLFLTLQEIMVIHQLILPLYIPLPKYLQLFHNPIN
jgi:hypothetical protein